MCRLLPDWKKWTYCNSLNYNDNDGEHDHSIWWNIFDEWVNKGDSKLLEYLSCSESPDIIRNYFNIIANKSNNCGSRDCKNVRMQPIDRVNSFLHTVAKHAKNDELLEYILRNFTEIVPR